jgi:hypothetical protein
MEAYAIETVSSKKTPSALTQTSKSVPINFPVLSMARNEIELALMEMLWSLVGRSHIRLEITKRRKDHCSC